MGWTLAGAALAIGFGFVLVNGWWAYYLPVARYGEFLLGVVAGLAVRDGWRPRVPAWAAGVTLVASIAASAALPKPMPNTFMAFPFLVAILAAAGRDLQEQKGWLTNRWLVFGGEASFTLYLVHSSCSST